MAADTPADGAGLDGTDDPIIDPELYRLGLESLAINSPLNCQPQQKQQHEEQRSNDGVVTFDITEKFMAACKTLIPGELVKDGYFTLFESVGALEIMDSKMDSGCLAEGESLDPDYDVGRTLLPSEVIGIIDQLLCHEMAWHMGYPLSQTLLTNLYIENMLSPEPTTIDEADFLRDSFRPSVRDPMHTVLRAYCLGLVKTCFYVNERIRIEHYYEEEDFVTNTYRRNLLDNISREAIREEIQKARAMLFAMHNLPSPVMQALDFRLQLRFAFLRALELTELRGHPESIKLPWVEMKGVLDQIRKSHPLGEPVPDAFSPKLQRRLASTMPPRPIVDLSFEDAYGHFKRMCVDGIEVNDVLKYTDSQALLNFVFWFNAKKPQPLVFIRTLLQYYICHKDTILGSRTIRQVLDDDLSVVVLPCSILLDPANDRVEAPQDGRFAIAQHMEVFRQRAAHHYVEIFRALSQNRCRIRRNLCHAIHEWELVQIDAEELDQRLQVQLDERPLESPTSEPVYSLPLSSWAYLYKLRMMEWIVQLGFELQVYQPDELPGMYWYLSYLASKRRQHVERIKTFTLESMNELRAAAAKTGSSSSLPAGKEAQMTRSLLFLRGAHVDAAATKELASGLNYLYAALHRLGLLPVPLRPYSTDLLRFEVRMKPFQNVGLPEMPTPDQFDREATAAARYPSVSDLLGAAEHAVSAARKSFELMSKFNEREAFCTMGGGGLGGGDPGSTTYGRWLAGIKSSLKSSIGAGVAIMTVRRAFESAGGNGAAAAQGAEMGKGMGINAEVPKPDAAYHEWWIVPKIMNKPVSR